MDSVLGFKQVSVYLGDIVRGVVCLVFEVYYKGRLVFYYWLVFFFVYVFKFLQRRLLSLLDSDFSLVCWGVVVYVLECGLVRFLLFCSFQVLRKLIFRFTFLFLEKVIITFVIRIEIGGKRYVIGKQLFDIWVLGINVGDFERR